ncbi:AlpA family phage regulatory protein [Mesorhizobium sp. B1-1-5]|uniref:helix-turn-helix transcriptional regulator n=1 Tax=Mesorhizobium sp. B1-1-5 TaxID=2589979 RepID=UPI00112A2388|nr:AlpA family phage regulatory protein [Mesorhizobium sp. B1-1-5]TPO07129.1 AlpA family phage regulatory protein [Mesorhizobium sp. B1-1-5]
MQLIPYEGLKAKGISYSPAHIWRLVKARKFPAPIKLGGGGRNMWVESEVDVYIARKIAERDALAAA